MPLVVNENSYVTVLEADDYFSDRFGKEAWAAETNKEGALISAAQFLDLACSWYNSPCEVDQKMAFPRIPDCPNVPQAVKDAQCEIAFSMVSSGGSETGAEPEMKKLKAGSVEMEWFESGVTNSSLMPDISKALLSSYGDCSASSLAGGSTRIIDSPRG